MSDDGCFIVVIMAEDDRFQKACWGFRAASRHIADNHTAESTAIALTRAVQKLISDSRITPELVKALVTVADHMYEKYILQPDLIGGLGDARDELEGLCDEIRNDHYNIDCVSLGIDCLRKFVLRGLSGNQINPTVSISKAFLDSLGRGIIDHFLAPQREEMMAHAQRNQIEQVHAEKAPIDLAMLKIQDYLVQLTNSNRAKRPVMHRIERRQKPLGTKKVLHVSLDTM
jgi:hypothetical protein